jgi:UMP-CMP kinase
MQKHKVQKHKVIFVLGGPGAGKGTHCKKLIEKFPHLVHIGIGDLLRASLMKKDNPELRQIMKEGKLSPGHVMGELIRDQVNITENNYQCIFLIDSFPRNEDNLNYWNKHETQNYDLLCVINFKCSEAMMLERIIQRSVLSGRVDDNVKTSEERIGIYKKDTQKNIKFFESQSIPIIHLSSEASIDETHQYLVEKIKEFINVQ